jgi:type IV pilus assembly protein PilO
MDKLKQYVVFTVLGCLVVLAAGWFLLVSPKRTNASELRAQSAAQRTSNANLATKLQVLKAQAKDLPKQQAKLAAVAAKIPNNPALPAMIRALTTASGSAGVELVSVAPGVPVSATTATPGAPAAPAAPGAAAAPAAPATAAAGTAGQLAAIPLTINVVGGYFQVQQFVANLEDLPRSLRVSALTVAPGANPVKKQAATATLDDGKSLTTTITAQVFMALNRPPAAAVAVPGQAAVPTTVTAPVASAKK